MTPDQLQEYLGRRLDAGVQSSEVSHGNLTVTLDADAYVATAELCRTDERLGMDFFDCLFGVDARDAGFDVVTILYSIAHRHRVILKHRCSGGRENPVAPTLTHLFRGADWHEREAWDMFGIEFDGHPGLAPRILCAENFEGWPLRKDFYLGSRAAKPWPGVKEPAETDEDGNVLEKVQLIGDAPGPTVLDELMAEQAKKVNPRQPELSEHEAEAVAAADTEGAEAAPGLASPTAVTDTAQVKERLDDSETAAREKAEGKRKEAAEARARKAAERAAETGRTPEQQDAPVSTPAQDTADAPKDAERAPERQQGGPPGAPTEGTLDAGTATPRPEEGASRPESPLLGGTHEKVDEQRADGSVPDDPRPSPEGAAPEQPGQDQDVVPSGQRGDADDAAAGYARADEPPPVEDARESARVAEEARRRERERDASHGDADEPDADQPDADVAGGAESSEHAPREDVAGGAERSEHARREDGEEQP